jgi:hypothetical protein
METARIWSRTARARHTQRISQSEACGDYYATAATSISGAISAQAGRASLGGAKHFHARRQQAFAGTFFLGGKPGAHGGGVFVERPTLPFTLVPLLLRRSRGGSNTPQPGSECHDCLVLFDGNCAAGAASERSEPTRQSMPDRHDAVSIWGPETRRQNGSAKAEAQQLGFGL